MMSETLSQSAQRVQNALRTLGFKNVVVELPDSTHSAAEAAQAIGCRVEEIAKSLVFKGKRSGRPILVIASGGNRVNEKSLAGLASEPVERADADFVRERTGFVIGGVPPVGHREQMQSFVDEDLLNYDEIWAAAGNPFAVFKLTPSELIAMTNGRVVSIK